MLRKLFFICFFLIASSSAQAQIHRYYLDGDNKFIDDPSKAKSYVKVMQDPSDSTWKMHMYSLRDTLLVIGSFKDAELTIPQGKFTYFGNSSSRTERQYNNDSNQMEDVVIPSEYGISQTGNYLNGQKDGEWVQSKYNGDLVSIITWKNGKMNGLSVTYGEESRKMFEGNFVNGVREGVWTTFAGSGAILTEEIYKNGLVTKKVDHTQTAFSEVNDSKPPSDFIRNLGRELKKIDFGNAQGRIMLFFKITKEGHLVCENPPTMKEFPEETILTVINIIRNSPPWKPASKKNGEVIEQGCPILIEVPSLEFQIGIMSNRQKLTND